MTDPAGIKKLWRNIDWVNKEEKFAFFNKYFKDGEIVNEEIKNANKLFKERILGYIEDNPEIKEDKATRKLTVEDVKKYIKSI